MLSAGSKESCAIRSAVTTWSLGGDYGDLRREGKEKGRPLTGAALNVFAMKPGSADEQHLLVGGQRPQIVSHHGLQGIGVAAHRQHGGQDLLAHVFGVA